jgi:hypothetical protein
MSGLANFVANKALVAELTAGALYHKAKGEWGEAVADEARRLALPHMVTGEYYRGITSDSDGSVGSTHFTSHFIEWGTVNMPAQAIIRRAVRSSGLELDEDPKPV